MQCFVPYKVMDKKYEAQAINFVKIAAAFTHKCKSTDLACSILVQKLVSQKKKERRQMKHLHRSNTLNSFDSPKVVQNTRTALDPMLAK